MNGRILTALAATGAAVVAAATLASAQTPPTTLHLVSKSQRHVGFFPKGAPKQGSRFGFGDRVTGDDRGSSIGVCTDVGGKLLCTIQVQLSKGTLTVQGELPERAHDTAVAITGGTGAYNGARGTAHVTDINSTTTDIVVELLP
jgi:Dirigent-like protein